MKFLTNFDLGLTLHIFAVMKWGKKEANVMLESYIVNR